MGRDWQYVSLGEHYTPVFHDGYRPRLEALVDRFSQAEVLHLNSTAAGGGVAEILTGLIPLKRWHGIAASWLVLPPNDEFFLVTRKIHDLLQGAPGALTDDDWSTYLSHVSEAATALPMEREKVWFVHDHQLLPLVDYLPPGDRKVWISHVDTSLPNPSILERLLPYIQRYDRLVFSMPEYPPAAVDPARVSICPPAIDPTRDKNHLISRDEALLYISHHGIDMMRPLIAQLSRFDIWKDPIGVIDAYRLAREQVPGTQLALVGALTAKDDAAATEVLATVQEYVGNDPDIHVYWDPEVVDDEFVRAFQMAPQVILQKSTREGFGLTVTEAMWKSQAVIGGDCGGIRQQITDGVNGFLVSDVAQCAGRIVDLLTDHALRERIGAAAHTSVREHYLLPRLACDYLEVASF